MPIFINVSKEPLQKDLCKSKTYQWLISNETENEDDGIRYKEDCSFSYQCGPNQLGVETCLSRDGETCAGNMDNSFTCKISKTLPDSIELEAGDSPGDWGIPTITECQPSQ